MQPFLELTIDQDQSPWKVIQAYATCELRGSNRLAIADSLQDDLCLVDEQGVVKEGGNMHSINPAGYVIHSAIHQARPDVIAAVHCHSVPSKAFSSLGIKLDPINQDACR